VLFERNASIQSKDNNDQTPLSLAAEKENLVMVKRLLERNADVHFKDKYGRRSLLLTTKN